MKTKEKQLKNQLILLNGEIPVDLPLNTFISINRNSPEKVYGLGFQPAKSIPEIPRWFLQKYLSKDSVILEPFAGSGTTIIETLKYGYSIYWLDYNPLSKLICRVKTSFFDCIKAKKLSGKLICKSKKQKFHKDTVNFSNKEFWFQKPVIEMLEILKENIILLDKNIQPLFWLAYSHTVRKVSNMNDSMILAARRPNVADVPKRTREDVLYYFENYLIRTINAIAEWNYMLNGNLKKANEVKYCDALELKGRWKCDAVITSPPYINAIDYVWASKFELHWLGFVKSNEDRLDLYSKEIGTERIPSKEFKELGKTGYDYIDKLLENIYVGKYYQASKGQNHLRARVVYKYFKDMKNHLISCYNKLNNKGYYCFTIGDFSMICGVQIPVASLLSKIAQEIGYKEIFRFHLLLRNRKLNIPRNVDWANTIKYDTTIVLERN